MSDSETRVHCGKHGDSRATFVCQHLATGEQLGFHQGFDPDDPDALFPDAWCDACERIRASEGGWSDRAAEFSDIKLICSGCYGELREKNWIQNDHDYEGLLNSSIEYLEERQAPFVDEFKLDDHERWDWDQETGKLVFSHDGQPQVEADIDFSGTFSTASNSWMWAWANRSLVEEIKSSSRQVREFGLENSFLRLAGGLWYATEQDGWEMTAVMARLLSAVGAYRTAGENSYTYMVVRNAQWVNGNRQSSGKILKFQFRGKRG